MLFCVVTTEMTIMTGERGQTRNGREVRTSEVDEDESKRKEREEEERDSKRQKKEENRREGRNRRAQSMT